jgi:hypothetical protein
LKDKTAFAKGETFWKFPEKFWKVKDECCQTQTVENWTIADAATKNQLPNVFSNTLFSFWLVSEKGNIRKVFAR